MKNLRFYVCTYLDGHLPAKHNHRNKPTRGQAHQKLLNRSRARGVKMKKREPPDKAEAKTTLHISGQEKINSTTELL